MQGVPPENGLGKIIPVDDRVRPYPHYTLRRTSPTPYYRSTTTRATLTRTRALRTYYYHRGGQDRRRCGDLVRQLGHVRNRVQNVHNVIRGSICYTSVLIRITTTGSTLGTFSERLLDRRIHAYITSSLHTNDSRGLSRLLGLLPGLVG